MRNDLTTSLLDAALEIGDAATDSLVTVAARIPVLAACFLDPTAEGLAEWTSAVGEKVGAVWEGAATAVTAWQAAAFETFLSPPTPTGAAHTALVVARAASGPAHRRVRANALRLGPSRG